MPNFSDKYCFNFRTKYDYLYEHIYTFRICSAKDEEEDDALEMRKQWGRFIAKHLDYLTNPSITYKNKKVIENLINNYLPSMDPHHSEDDSVFKCAQAAVKEMLAKRYFLKSESLDQGVIDYFSEQKTKTEERKIMIHEPGKKEDIVEYLRPRFSKISKKQYDSDAPFVKKTLKSLPKCMPRLDQLPMH